MRFLYEDQPKGDPIRLIGELSEVREAEQLLISYALGLVAAREVSAVGLRQFCTTLVQRHAVERVTMPYFDDFHKNGIESKARDQALIGAALRGELTSAQLHKELGLANKTPGAVVNTSGLSLESGYELHTIEVTDRIVGDLGRPIARLADEVGATCYGYQHELQTYDDNPNLYTLRSNREHTSLGRMTDEGFQPITTALSNDHPVMQGILEKHGSDPSRNIADMPTLDDYRPQ